MLFITFAACATVAAALITTCRVIGWRRVAKHATLVDVIFTVFMAVLLFGTLTGMLVAILSGLFMAIILTCMRYLVRIIDAANAHIALHKGELGAKGEWVYNEKPYI